MDSSEKFLAEIQDALDRRLAPEEIRERLSEIAAHLDETVEAFAEMGLDEDAAVRAMGCPQRLARGLSEAALSRPHRRRLGAATVALGALCALLAGHDYLDSIFLTSLGSTVAFLAILGAGFGALRARRPATIWIAAISLGLVLPMASLRAWLCVELPIPGTARLPFGIKTLVYRPYGPDRLLRSIRVNGQSHTIADLMKGATPFTKRVAGHIPKALGDAAGSLLIVGATDAAFSVGWLSLIARRRKALV